MKKILFLLFFLLIVVLGLRYSQTAAVPVAQRFQQDADRLRMEHLVYWAGLIDQYQSLTGYYPLQQLLQPGQAGLLVRLQTPTQHRYVAKGSAKYQAAADINADGRYAEAPVRVFVAALEQGLNGPVMEKYDVQQAPLTSAIGYNYLVTPEGYVLWTQCATCGDTAVSTPKADGTAEVAIASTRMLVHNPKARELRDMLADPVFAGWLARGLHKEAFVRGIERAHMHDSKRPVTE